MDLVVRTLGLLILMLASTAGAGPMLSEIEPALDRWQPLIDEAAHRFSIPAPWIRDVMRLESAGQAFIGRLPITSPAGAMGLMQIMPATYAELRERYGFGADPYDPHDNILAGVAYLRELYERYGWPSLFAAYHAGPARFEAYLSTGKPLPEATHEYLAALIPESSTHNRRTPPPTSVATIFVPLSHGDRTVNSASSLTLNDRLFFRLKARRVASEGRSGDGDDANQETSDVRDP